MLNKFSVSAKLYMLICITAASLIGLGAYSINDLKAMNENTKTLYADRVLALQLLSNVRLAYTTEIVSLPQKVKDKVITFSEARKRSRQAEVIINTNWHEYKLTYLTPKEALLVKQADVTKNKADKVYDELQTVLSKEDTGLLKGLIQREFSDGPAPFTLKLTQLMHLQAKIGKEVFDNNNQIFQATSTKLFFLILLTLVIALALSFFIIKNIKNLIKDILAGNVTIRESQDKYQSLFEQASDAIYVLNAKGDFTNVNKSMCELVGYNRDELLTMNIAALVNAELLSTNPLRYSVVKPGEALIAERRIIHKSGLIKDVEINGKKFPDNRVVEMVRDITERNAMELELKKAELKFRTLADKSMVGIYILQRGRFVYVNPRFAEIFHYEPHEVTGFTDGIDALIHADYKAIAAENIRVRLEDGQGNAHYEAIGKKKYGSTNWIEFYGSGVIFDGEPTIIGTMIDITERKIAELKLRSSEQKYKMLFDSNPSSLWMIAKNDLSIIAVNKAAIDLYGYTKDELLKMTIRDMRFQEDMDQVIDSYKLEIDRPVDMGITRHIKKDGTIMLVQIIAHDIIFEGRPVRLVHTNDVTEKLKAEELLKKTEANLQTILNTTNTAYALLDRNLGILEYNNKALAFAKKEFNFNPENGGKLFDHIPEDRRLQFHEHITNVLKGKAIDYEINYPQHGAVDIWYHVRMFPISSKKNEIIGIVLAINDITGRKDAERDLRLSYERTKTHIKFIRELIWKQSHILRSPLANLRGLIAIIRNNPADEEALNYLEMEFERMDLVFREMAKDSAGDEMKY